MPKLCSFGCAPSGVPMHRFPNADKFPERLKAWVNLVGGKLETADDYAYYQTKLVCDIHFTAKDRNRNNRLNALAVPSLHLHGTSVREPDISLVSQPSDLHATNTATIHGTATTSAVMMDHSEASRCSRKTFRMGSTKSSLKYSYVQVKALSTKVKQLRSEISRLRKRGLSFKSRLANAAKLSQDATFQQVMKNLKTPAQLFVHMQLQSAKKSKGRFTMDEKILALSIYKTSPKAYSLLYKYFTLPSTKAMKHLLSQIKLHPGINPIVFQKIKKTVLEKDTADCLCEIAKRTPTIA